MRNHAMDAEPPTARFEVDDRSRRPGHRNRSPTRSTTDVVNPYQPPNAVAYTSERAITLRSLSELAYLGAGFLYVSSFAIIASFAWGLVAENPAPMIAMLCCGIGAFTLAFIERPTVASAIASLAWCSAAQYPIGCFWWLREYDCRAQFEPFSLAFTSVVVIGAASIAIWRTMSEVRHATQNRGEPCDDTERRWSV